MIFNGPVYPIPPSFTSNEILEELSTRNYLSYLYENGAGTVMTTAGTSQFNLMSVEEIREFNAIVSSFLGKKILGIPAMSKHHLTKEILYYNSQNYSNTFLLLIFPERYYNDDQIVEFFDHACRISEYPILAHCNPLKKGNGGVYEYGFDVLKKLSTLHNFIGIKEESSTLEYSMMNLQSLDLEIIVAGGSMRRFWSLEPFGATTYLSGVGSFNPKYEEDFYRLYKNSLFAEAKHIIEEIETPLFNTFMRIGWHASMRESLKSMKYISCNRSPFINLSQSATRDVVNSLTNVMNKHI
jgi:dihydrodipicolinate synthase/N-acetylneuraminate lyase